MPPKKIELDKLPKYSNSVTGMSIMSPINSDRIHPITYRAVWTWVSGSAVHSVLCSMLIVMLLIVRAWIGFVEHKLLL